MPAIGTVAERMREKRNRYSIIQMNNWSERGWGVVDEKGALIRTEGLAVKLTKAEAKAIADDKNREDDQNFPSPGKT